MPIFAAVFTRTIAYLMSAFIYLFGQQLGIKWAERAFVAALAAAFFLAVTACVSSLLGYLSGVGGGGSIGLLGRFMQGVGMLVPSNAVGVIGCVASVWLACVVYRTKMGIMKVG